MSRLFALSIIIASTAATAEPLPETVRAHAARRTGSISVDGELDEPVWVNAQRNGGFIQRFPKAGAKATHDTQFAFLYDDDAIYVGVWADDPEPALIRRLLTRRDVDAPADLIAIGIDSYHDRRTAYVFKLNAAGVQHDSIVFDDSSEDQSWDAVWRGDVATSPRGWTAEFRIPLSQLRFAGGETQAWGLQVMRIVARSQEASTWSPWPRTGSQIVSRFGIVDGIDHVPPSRRIEILPYASGGVSVQPIAPGDPLNDHTSLLGNAGLDVKFGLGPAFTLSATINPDFGQVEADPSQVNLSTNELFFAEKRPFFIEGVDLFKLPIGNGDDLIEGAFYSRRIGATPATPDMDYDYIKAPSSTTIYGATKLTGKTRNGWSIGVLDAVTGEESATIVDGAGTQMAPLVAPVTNFAVGRVKRDLRGGNTTLGASATSVHRALDNTSLAPMLHDQAYTAGVQLKHRWATNAWELELHGVGSSVHGSAEAIALTQQSNRHLFQRPDADHIHFDPTRTSMAGAGLTWGLGRSGETAHWRWATGGDIRTPGLELNDVGFQTSSDRVEPWLWGEYRDDDPGKHVLHWRTSAVAFAVNNFEPRLLTYGTKADINAQLASYWSFSTGLISQSSGWDTMELRGGPALRVNPRLSGFANISTDSRKRVRIDLFGNASRDWIGDSMQVTVGGGALIQARSNIDIFIGPSWFERTDPMQYITQVDDSAGTRHYVFGRIKQTTASATVRLNWTFSPRLSVQAYAQPFIATASYSELKDVDQPGAPRFTDRFEGVNQYSVMDGTVYVNDGNSYQFARPDFDLGQLRSTMVLRWEYRPGSAVFAIWSHGRTNFVDEGRFALGDDLAALGRAPGENIVMVKANYWIGL